MNRPNKTTLPRHYRQLPPLTLLLAVALLSACGSSGSAREDSYYRLDLSTTPTPVKHPYPGTLLVAKLDGRGFAADRAIIFRDATQQDQVQRYTYHLWAEAPTLTVQDLLAHYLREAGTARFVVTPTQRVRADLIISGTLFLMEQHPYDQPPGVVVELELGMVRADRREPLFLTRYHAEHHTADAQLQHAIPAFDAALADIFSQFLADLEAALPALPTPADAS